MMHLVINEEKVNKKLLQRPFSIPQPRDVGSVNWLGLWELYMKEVRRFTKIPLQTVGAPVITGLLFLLIFMFAFGDLRGSVAGVPFIEFLAPGLIMMAMIQNAFINTSSSILVAKVQGNIVDVLMPPLSALELAIGWTAGAVTRGLMVGAVSLLAMSLFVDIHVHNPWIILFHAVFGCIFMASIGILGAIWADKFDHMATVTNFVITPLIFLSGTFYTIDRLPDGFRMIANYNPFFYCIDGFRYGFIGQDSAQLEIGIVVQLLINCVALFTTYKVIKSGYKLKA